MMDKRIYDFEECIEIANKKASKKHLILGNGFSIDLFPKIFNYKALSQNVNSSQVKTLFELLGTSDFEHVMRMLTTALKVVKAYPNNTQIVNQIESHLNEIRDGLIQAISVSHPEKPSLITEDEYEHCRLFLEHFDDGKKYTFNYDLLLYWVYMHFLEEDKENKKKQFNDGFRHPTGDDSIVTWEIGREIYQNVYYIHGAMHIFNDGAEVEKFTWINKGVNISDQVRESISKNKYPIFISEGKKDHKLARIYSSSYLGRSFSSLKNIGGNLFIFGHSINENDDHVFDYINENSKLKNIFISIHGDVNLPDNQYIINRVNKWKEKYKGTDLVKEYYFYDAKTANVWETPTIP